MNSLEALLAHPSFDAHFPILNQQPPLHGEPGYIFPTKAARDAFLTRRQLAFNQLMSVPVTNVDHPAFTTRTIAHSRDEAGVLHWFLRQGDNGGWVERQADPAVLAEHRAFMYRFQRFYSAVHGLPMGAVGYAGMVATQPTIQLQAAVMMQNLAMAQQLHQQGQPPVPPQQEQKHEQKDMPQ